MFKNQIFICHTAGEKEQAESIAISLRGRGYRVFLDKDTLPPGRSYDKLIQKAIKQSSAFVFMITPQSVQGGRYTLTELMFASKKWPHPAKTVLPVMVKTTDLSTLPIYLKGATILEPHGSVSAEVSATIASMVAARSYPKILAVAAAIAIVLCIGIYAISSSQSSPPLPEPVHQTTYSAVAQCARTDNVGRGTGDTKEDAGDDAINDCEANGGAHGCCRVIDVREE
jgi:hypothetical protein